MQRAALSILALLGLLIAAAGPSAGAARVQLQIPALGIDSLVPVDSQAPTRLAVVGGATHNADFWADLAPGWELRLRRPGGGWESFEVTGSAIAGGREIGGEPEGPGADRPALTLITPYSAQGETGTGPLHYLVFAEAIGETAEN